MPGFLTYIISVNPHNSHTRYDLHDLYDLHDIIGVIIPILQIMKERQIKFKRLAQDLTASAWQN